MAVHEATSLQNGISNMHLNETETTPDLFVIRKQHDDFRSHEITAAYSKTEVKQKLPQASSSSLSVIFLRVFKEFLRTCALFE